MKYIILATLFAIVVISMLIAFTGSQIEPKLEQTGSAKLIQASFPEPTNYVVDDAGALRQATVDRLNQDLKAFDEKGQIAVLVVKSTKPLTIEQYGIELAEKWKVGHEGKDDGVILILATEDRKVRIEVGKGAEAVIPDAVAGRIIDERMISSLKQSNWEEAIIQGVAGIKSKLQ